MTSSYQGGPHGQLPVIKSVKKKYSCIGRNLSCFAARLGRDPQNSGALPSAIVSRSRAEQWNASSTHLLVTRIAFGSSVCTNENL